jgi:hypothetical protein
MALPSLDARPKTTPSAMESPPTVVNPPEPTRITRQPILVALPMGLQEWVYPTRE